MTSYHRECKHCGRLIQLRLMPGGQWVAFEGYDTVHDCSTPVRRSFDQGTGVRLVLRAGRDIEGTSSTASESSEEVARIGGERRSIRELVDLAINTRQVLRIVYESRSMGLEATARDIEPLKRDGTYCYAYCRMRQDFRQFRLDKIKGVELKNEDFVPRVIPPSAFSWSPSKTHWPGPPRPIPGMGRKTSPGVWWSIVVAIILLIWFLTSCIALPPFTHALETTSFRISYGRTAQIERSFHAPTLRS